MAMTMTQKILAAHAGLDKVEAGELILVNLDRVLGNDITSPVAIREFNNMGANEVYDKEKVSSFYITCLCGDNDNHFRNALLCLYAVG